MKLDDVEIASPRAVALPADPTSATGLRAENPDWAQHVAGSGSLTQELTWPLPYCPQRDRPRREVEALHRLILASLDDDQAVETISIPLAQARPASPITW